MRILVRLVQLGDGTPDTPRRRGSPSCTGSPTCRRSTPCAARWRTGGWSPGSAGCRRRDHRALPRRAQSRGWPALTRWLETSRREPSNPAATARRGATVDRLARPVVTPRRRCWTGPGWPRPRRSSPAPMWPGSVSRTASRCSSPCPGPSSTARREGLAARRGARPTAAQTGTVARRRGGGRDAAGAGGRAGLGRRPPCP